MPFTFHHGLNPTFIKNLKTEAKKEGGWWKDVLAHRELFIAVRDRYLDVYWHGQRLFHVSAGGLKVSTHEKYLLDPSLASQVPLVEGRFDLKKLLKEGFIDRYKGTDTLEKLKKAADSFSGLEKIGCHQVAINNSAVIDCEIAFPGRVTLSNGKVVNTPRVDLASLKAVSTDTARLVFWEAKHFSNGELRTAGEEWAPVCYQVEGYQDYLYAHRDAVVESYRKVAENLVAIGRMGWKRSLSPLFEEISTGKRQLTLGENDEKPEVGLIIFGFDMGQRDHPGWKDNHLPRLRERIRPVLPRGDAKAIKLPT
jgi:hypothetical protein